MGETQPSLEKLWERHNQPNGSTLNFASPDLLIHPMYC
jgi:hypothetical protein